VARKGVVKWSILANCTPLNKKQMEFARKFSSHTSRDIWNFSGALSCAAGAVRHFEQVSIQMSRFPGNVFVDCVE
jgi:hypothetical protein